MAQVIPDGWQVPARIRQRVGAQAGRQRAIVEEGHLLLVLHELPKDGEIDRAAKLFWRAPDGAWRATGAGQSSGLPVLHRHLDTYKQAITALDARVEAGKTAQDFFAVLNEATPLQRSARNLHAALQEAREGVDDREIISARDTAGTLERGAEILVSDARNALDYTIAKNAEAQAASSRQAVEAQHKLNLLAAMFFPITAIGSMLGTNLHTGLEHAPPALFWGVVVAALVVGFVIRGSLDRKP